MDNSQRTEPLEDIDISELDMVALNGFLSRVRSLIGDRLKITRRIVMNLQHLVTESCPKYYRIGVNLQLPDNPEANDILEEFNTKTLKPEPEILATVIQFSFRQLEDNTVSLNILFSEEDTGVSTRIRKIITRNQAIEIINLRLSFRPLLPDSRIRISALKRRLNVVEKIQVGRARHQKLCLKDFLLNANHLTKTTSNEIPPTSTDENDINEEFPEPLETMSPAKSVTIPRIIGRKAKSVICTSNVRNRFVADRINDNKNANNVSIPPSHKWQTLPRGIPLRMQNMRTNRNQNFSPLMNNRDVASRNKNNEQYMASISGYFNKPQILRNVGNLKRVCSDLNVMHKIRHDTPKDSKLSLINFSGQSNWDLIKCFESL